MVHQQSLTHFRVEEDFWSKEPLVADVDGEGLLRDRVLALVNLDPLGRLRVILGELLHNVWADIRVLLLHNQSIHHSTLIHVHIDTNIELYFSLAAQYVVTRKPS